MTHSTYIMTMDMGSNNPPISINTTRLLMVGRRGSPQLSKNRELVPTRGNLIERVIQNGRRENPTT